MRFALAQINPIVGDLRYNADRIFEMIQRAKFAGAQILIFPELALVGYPPKDLLLKSHLIDRCQQLAEEIAQQADSIAIILGYPARSSTATGLTLQNTIAFCSNGKIQHQYAKRLLPTYDVFDESRYFEPGSHAGIVTHHNVKLGLSICEDLWNEQNLFDRQLYHEDPAQQLADQGADLIINCAASPYEINKHDFRLNLFQTTVQKLNLPILYVNQVGANDELVFDGNSCSISPTGQTLAHAQDFDTDLLLVEIPFEHEQTPAESTHAHHHDRWQLPDEKVGRLHQPAAGIPSVFSALALGLRDYCRKCKFKTIVLGLSGGIDSAVSACIAVEALGSENVIGITMPSRFSSDHSVSDAEQLATNLGIAFYNIPIKQAHEALEESLQPILEYTEPDITEENIQARLRGIILMAQSNKTGSLLVTTGNKSELAVGYCTLYGDMCGGLAILSDVPKTMVYDLAHYINSPESNLYDLFSRASIPQNTIDKPPSAELRPDQTDQDSLPPYDILDQIIHLYIERHLSARQIAEQTSLDYDLVLRFVTLIDRNEYKRKQTPPGIKVTSRAFGFGRRMPIAQRYDPTNGEQDDDE